jgi:hypothetical protein
MYRVELSKDGQNWVITYEGLSREKGTKLYEELLHKTDRTYPHIRLVRCVEDVVLRKHRLYTTHPLMMAR